ncbi:hypothetical protein, partial [Enterococcus hirae]|uniref:hypothetical protein n=1 Tax=Enterococcus hirae TaxID=1354 RepID=UPI00136B0F2B
MPKTERAALADLASTATTTLTTVDTTTREQAQSTAARFVAQYFARPILPLNAPTDPDRRTPTGYQQRLSMVTTIVAGTYTTTYANTDTDTDTRDAAAQAAARRIASDLAGWFDNPPPTGLRGGAPPPRTQGAPNDLGEGSSRSTGNDPGEGSSRPTDVGQDQQDQWERLERLTRELDTLQGKVRPGSQAEVLIARTHLARARGLLENLTSTDGIQRALTAAETALTRVRNDAAIAAPGTTKLHKQFAAYLEHTNNTSREAGRARPLRATFASPPTTAPAQDSGPVVHDRQQVEGLLALVRTPHHEAWVQAVLSFDLTHPDMPDGNVEAVLDDLVNGADDQSAPPLLDALLGHAAKDLSAANRTAVTRWLRAHVRVEWAKAQGWVNPDGAVVGGRSQLDVSNMEGNSASLRGWAAARSAHDFLTAIVPTAEQLGQVATHYAGPGDLDRAKALRTEVTSWLENNPDHPRQDIVRSHLEFIKDARITLRDAHTRGQLFFARADLDDLTRNLGAAIRRRLSNWPGWAPWARNPDSTDPDPRAVAHRNAVTLAATATEAATAWLGEHPDPHPLRPQVQEAVDNLA